MKRLGLPDRCGWCAALLCMALLGHGAITARAADLPRDQISLTLGVDFPMRDGIRLRGNLYRPRDVSAPLPVIVALSPYTADRYHDQASYFARHGYIFILVDTRGRGASEGQFLPFHHDAPDGHDLIEWVSQQPWCNGKVAMWGGSYLGFVQWATLKQRPPHLATIVPSAAVGIGADVPFLGGIADPYEARWAVQVQGHAANSRLFADPSFWLPKYLDAFVRHVPFREFGELVGYPSEWFRITAQHPAHDPYWRQLGLTAEQYRGISIPILTITGAYDSDQLGALDFYRSHLRHGPVAVTARHYLLIGPWDHAGTRTPKPEVGGLPLGPASVIDVNGLHREWYDWTLRDGTRPPFLQDRVAYYVTGAEAWKYASDLGAVTATTQTLFLGSSGAAQDAYHSGTLSARARGTAAYDTYVYDPLDVQPAAREAEEITRPITDQRYALRLYGSGLVYHSEPFEAATELAGVPRLEAWVRMNVPDTDFQATLYEIHPDGASVLLTSQLLRARYRESLEREISVPIDRIVRYTFDGFPFFARQVAAGSRLRLVFAAPNTIYRQKNYNSGGVVSDETAADARVARVQLYHDVRYPSQLVLPIGHR